MHVNPVPAGADVAAPHRGGDVEQDGEIAVRVRGGGRNINVCAGKGQIFYHGAAGEAGSGDGDRSAGLAPGGVDGDVGEVHPLVFHPGLVHLHGADIEVDKCPVFSTGFISLDIYHVVHARICIVGDCQR